jgi:hypothetical protein
MLSFFRPALTEVNKYALGASLLGLKFLGAKADGEASLNDNTMITVVVIGAAVVILCCIAGASNRRNVLHHPHHVDPPFFVHGHDHIQPHHDHLLVRHGDHLHDVVVNHHDGHMDDVDIHSHQGYEPPRYI